MLVASVLVRRVAFIIGTGSDTQVLGAARRRDGAPLPAVKGMVLMVLLRVDCARRTSASRSCAAAGTNVRGLWVSGGALLRSVEEQQRLHFK